MSSDTPLQDTFAFKLGDLLSTRWGKLVDAINGGVDGYGTYQEMAYYRYLGRFLSPGVVVLCVFTGNDFRDNMVSTMNRSRISSLLLKDDTPGYRHRENLLFSSEERLTDPLSGALVQQPSSSIYAELLRRSAILRLIISRLHLLKGRLTADFFPSTELVSTMPTNWAYTPTYKTPTSLRRST